MDKKLVFFGSSGYSVLVLQILLDRKITIAAVVTTPDKPVGRHLKLTPNPVKVLALKNNVPVFEDIKKYLEWSQNQNLIHAIGLCVSYKKLVGPKTRATLNNRIYNIHPSLLPKYRGPSPVPFQILNNEKETGYTFYLLDDLEDHGPIVYQEKDIISSTDTTFTLAQKLFSKAAEKLIASDFSILDNPPIPQDETQTTDTRLLTRQDGFIPYQEFQKQIKNRDQLLINKFRALCPWPGVWSLDPHGHRLILTSINPLSFRTIPS